MIDVSDILTPGVLKSVGDQGVSALNEAVNAILVSESARIESEYAAKFDELVESITRKFDDRVEGVIVESVRSTVGDSVNKKMYGLVKDMVNLLENAGISTTEKTKDALAKLGDAEKKLQQSYKEYEEVKREMDGHKKNEYILMQLKGTHPKIIDAALEYFKDKMMIDVEDEIDAFINGDFKHLLGDEGSLEEKLGDIDIDQVRDVLDGIDREKTDRKRKNAFTESIGKGLAPQKAVGGAARNPNITVEALEQSSAPRMLTDEEVDEALQQVHAYDQLGYRFR